MLRPNRLVYIVVSNEDIIVGGNRNRRKSAFLTVETELVRPNPRSISANQHIRMRCVLALALDPDHRCHTVVVYGGVTQTLTISKPVVELIHVYRNCPSRRRVDRERFHGIRLTAFAPGAHGGDTKSVPDIVCQTGQRVGRAHAGNCRVIAGNANLLPIQNVILRILLRIPLHRDFTVAGHDLDDGFLRGNSGPGNLPRGRRAYAGGVFGRNDEVVDVRGETLYQQGRSGRSDLVTGAEQVAVVGVPVDIEDRRGGGCGPRQFDAVGRRSADCREVRRSSGARHRGWAVAVAAPAAAAGSGGQTGHQDPGDCAESANVG